MGNKQNCKYSNHEFINLSMQLTIKVHKPPLHTTSKSNENISKRVDSHSISITIQFFFENEGKSCVLFILKY